MLVRSPENLGTIRNQETDKKHFFDVLKKKNAFFDRVFLNTSTNHQHLSKKSLKIIYLICANIKGTRIKH